MFLFLLCMCGDVKDSVSGVINVLNMMEVFTDKTNASSFGTGGCDYFHVLCQQSFPGPLVGGNAGSKEVNKWIDDRIANYETPYTDFRRWDLLRLLFSLLKISFQYYGKLRSPFGTDQLLKVTHNFSFINGCISLWPARTYFGNFNCLLIRNFKCSSHYLKILNQS